MILIQWFLIKPSVKIGSVIRVDDHVGIGLANVIDHVLYFIRTDNSLADEDLAVAEAAISFKDAHPVMTSFHKGLNHRFRIFGHDLQGDLFISLV